MTKYRKIYGKYAESEINFDTEKWELDDSLTETSAIAGAKMLTMLRHGAPIQCYKCDYWAPLTKVTHII